MKSRFTTLDIRAVIAELRQRFLGMRVMNVYDVDNKTYLIKLAKPDMKAMILMESGIRIHSTNFEWPKNITPSSFSMKLRKHLRTRRLEKVEQLGMDRIVDLQFGSGEAAYHIILELYDRGNLVLTDCEYTILNILRPRTDKSEDVRFAVHEKYPVESAKQPEGPFSQEKLMSILLAANEGDNLKKILSPNLAYGPALIEHSLLSAEIPANARMGKEFNIEDGMQKLMAALEIAESMLGTANDPCKGYVIQKREKKAALNEEAPQELLTYMEFHPFLFQQHANFPYIEFESFDKAVDEFFSQIGSQKLDMKTLQQERAAMKKLEHIKKDHEKRLEGLQKEQDTDMNKASLIEMNLDLVDRAIMIVRSAIANQIDWDEILTIVKEAQIQGDPVASCIKSLKLDSNHIILFLKDPYLDSDEEAAPDDLNSVIPMKVDIDLELSAYANARKYFDKKRKAATKEQKTVDASKKALKSAEKKTLQTLKEVQTVATINKARKTYWFEKFLWFITSENYLVIGGRDQQQNEHIVKKYLKPGDLYVHADLHGASSVIIKNTSGEPVPPKSLNEAGSMALCNSAAWDAKVVTSAWWVYHHQVTKTAPSGEYLTTGSFMIRGKKNFLPPSYLIYGFAFLFKVDEDCVFRHKGERRVRTLEEDTESVADSETTEASGDTESADVLEQDSSSSDSENEDSQASENISSTHGDLADSQEQLENDEGKTDKETLSNVNDEHTIKDEKRGNVDSHIDTPDMNEDDCVKQTPDEESQVMSSEDEENLFPDTKIDLQYVQGDRLRLHASRTDSRTISTGSVDPDDTTDTQTTDQPNKCVRLSAKQRREMKKKAKLAQLNSESKAEADEEDKVSHEAEEQLPQHPQAKPNQEREQPQVESSTSKKQSSLPDPPQPKRRQKAKLKKKEKYKDQDEEERRLKMEILASAGPQKEKKEDKKKGKKNKQQHGRPQSCQGQGHNPQQVKGYPHRKLTIEDIKVEDSEISAEGSAVPGTVAASIEQEEALSDEEKQTLLEEENIKIGQDLNELDSLTGIPVAEDILHFCIPVCGPYGALLNYKYKVKLTPGSTKRGKAAKAAVYSFAHDRNATNRERDLFKSLKDVDLSRNVPGKVKVSGPNLLKQKKKK